LRNAFYTEYQVPAGAQAIATGRLVHNNGDGRTAYVSREECAAAAGMPEPEARAVATYGRAIREGYLDETSGAVQILTGRPPRSLREVLEAHRGELLQ